MLIVNLIQSLIWLQAHIFLAQLSSASDGEENPSAHSSCRGNSCSSKWTRSVYWNATNKRLCFCGGSSVSCARSEGLPISLSLLCSTVDRTPQLVSQLQPHQSDPGRHVQSGTEITAYTRNLFACNPLIIDVKAVIYKWSVRSVFKNANSCTSSPSLIIKGILCVCVCFIHTLPQQMNS